VADYTLYDVVLSLITPLHIGNGRELLYEYDYAIHADRTWRFNESALLDAQVVDDLEMARKLSVIKPAELLQPADFDSNSNVFRYVLKGMPRSREAGAQLREQFKNVFDQPYLPGSSLKGALRTSLAWHAWKERQYQLKIDQMKSNPKWAAQNIEQSLFGSNPNQDWLRALHVGDSSPVSPEQMTIVNARVLTRGGELGSPIELEALRSETQLKLTVKLDRALFSEWARQGELRLSERVWLEQLMQIVQTHSVHRIQRELAWYKPIPNAIRLVELYQQLSKTARLGSQRCLIQLGWGTGWESKTLGSHLSHTPNILAQVIANYRLARGRRKEGDPFPKSRRVVVGFERDAQGRTAETLQAPLGWCLVEIQPR
jgi:CRISPR-associated protein Csm5